MHKEQKRLPFRRLYNALLSLALMAAATLIGLLFRAVGFPETNIVIVYLLAVLLCARLTTGFAYGLAVSVLATVAFNFFFTAPYHSLQVYDASYWVTFVIMTVVALLTSALTSRVKKSVQEAARREQETQALYALTSRLSETEGTAAIARVTIQSLREVFGLSAVIVWLEDAAGPEESLTRRLKEAGGEALIDGGRSLWPITGRESLLGVLQVPAEEGMLLEKSQKKLLRAMLECTALAVDRFRATREQLRYREESEQERYRGNLLRAISHDLRTPLSGIMGTSEMIRDMSEKEDPRRELAQGIWEDADWLHSLVENILNLTRLEEGRLVLQKQPEAVEEIIGNALEHIAKRAPEREIGVDIPDELLLVPMDARLIVQVLVNLLDNAIKHTAAEREIRIAVQREGTDAVFRVSDRGEGIAPADLPHIFKMFYTSQHNRADAKRGIGLGLAICDAIVGAHGGTIQAENRAGGGAVFRFTLPMEAREHE